MPTLERGRYAILIAVIALHCGGSGGAPPDMAVGDLALLPPLCTDPVSPDGGLAPTFGNVQKIFADNCLFACHCCSNEVDLNPDRAYADLVNMPPPVTAAAGDLQCGSTLVKPGDPANSYLFQKLTMTKPCYGAQMPLSEFGSGMLPDCEIDIVRRWILAGAPND
jgi:hypothetical protein